MNELMFDSILDFILDVPQDFHRDGAGVHPGDTFARCASLKGDWVYVEVLALNDGSLPEGSIYGRAFLRDRAYGFEGHCRLDELHLRLDADAWARIRNADWGPPAMTLLDDPVIKRDEDTRELPGRTQPMLHARWNRLDFDDRFGTSASSAAGRSCAC